MSVSVPRDEYPRPQFVRTDWLCLNGEWQFEVDQGDSGLERGLLDRELNQKVVVPFCPESKLSGIEDHDFLNAVWYRRTITVPKEWGSRRVLLHFQAVDYDTTVWVNGTEVARHRGGFTPFTCDLSGVARPGESATIVVRARDHVDPPQPRGKQTRFLGPYGPNYVRTTGIWQTVWLEPVPETALLRPRITPDVPNGMLRLEQRIEGNRRGTYLYVSVTDEGGEVVKARTSADLDLVVRLDLVIPTDKIRHWSTSDPHLYSLTIELRDTEGALIDKAESYAGLRSVNIDGKAIRLNGKIVFQRLVLDQGYYPDGLMTAPTDDALRNDIILSKEAGFNGARLHQKVFEERFLYHADSLGYIVWGEFGDWGCSELDRRRPERQYPGPEYLTQWLEVLERDYSHPSIVGWCPLNETRQVITDEISTLDDVTLGMFLATKATDLTRPVVDASGYSHRVPFTDVYDSHDYSQNPEAFAKRQSGLANDEPYLNGPKDFDVFTYHSGNPKWSVPYNGQPYFVSEFGGIWWSSDPDRGEDSWGYGERPQSIDEFYERFEGLCKVLLEDKNMFGYCYTQLTDVFQEQNGILQFDRTPKFDMARIRAAQQVQAAIESGD